MIFADNPDEQTGLPGHISWIGCCINDRRRESSYSFPLPSKIKQGERLLLLKPSDCAICQFVAVVFVPLNGIYHDIFGSICSFILPLRNKLLKIPRSSRRYICDAASVCIAILLKIRDEFEVESNQVNAFVAGVIYSSL
jgi:hypothetical protein